MTSEETENGRTASWVSWLADQLRSMYGDAAIVEDARAEAALRERIASMRHSPSRYAIVGEVGRGGMGAVYEVVDEALDRRLAMKVSAERPAAGTPPVPDRDSASGGDPLPETPAQESAPEAVDPQRVRRLVTEARLLGRLQHPGVVPVHELGVDPDGRVYFTMPLVGGGSLAEVFRNVRSDAPGWSLSRALETLIRVCDTLAYAHDNEVVHRDVKPSNVLVGRFGEVYVVDWGLAAPMAGDGSPSAPRGDGIVGTPFYMSPEQAAGDVDAIDPSADVYSVGAMLYELLSGRPPYAFETEGAAPDDVLAAIHAGPPRPLDVLAPDAPGELVAVCEKAMTRTRAERYASMLDLADELRAYSEGRVVQAHRTGAAVEIRKWIQRNRVLAATVAAALLVLAAAGLWFVSMLAIERHRAHEHALEADRNLDEILDLAVVERVRDLRRRADEELWPAAPRHIDAMKQWLAEAAEVEPVRAKLATRRAEILASAPAAAETSASAPSGVQRQWRTRLLDETLRELDAFLTPDVSGGTFLGSTVGEMRRRAAFALENAARSTGDVRVAGGRASAALWREAIAAIREHPDYHGLEIGPQNGLVPLGPDPGSGLWEFAHLQSGEPAVRDANRRLAMAAESGLVLVLVPAGRFTMGAQRSGATNVDVMAEELNEKPLHEVELSAFFVSKFEMTQAQWTRVVGRNPSNHDAASEYVDDAVAPLHPVETIVTTRCTQVPTYVNDGRRGAVRGGRVATSAGVGVASSLPGSGRELPRVLCTGQP